MKDPIKEEEFYNGDYKFSYSSLNKLLFSPKLFYKDYILKERELKTDKHLIEGKLLHLVLLQPDKLHDEFSIVPNKIPSDNVRKVLKTLSNRFYDPNAFIKLKDLDNEIIKVLEENNLYQSFKDDLKKLSKIQTKENEEYYKFLCENQKKDIIDNDMLVKATERVKQIKSNKNVMSLLEDKVTDFELDPLESYNEKYLECELNDYVFGLKGYIDRYIIDHESKEITIIDFKTTSKGLDKFAETVDYYNYWMQAVIYITLVIKSSKKDITNYKINFNFVVVDNYDQVYVFDVSNNTLQNWYQGFTKILEEANYHYIKRDYSLPYEFANNNVIL
tara:strand:+ start:3036 stop:4031 length:996 start_codon:yes stop_codon:yes gene_type:complete